MIRYNFLLLLSGVLGPVLLGQELVGEVQQRGGHEDEPEEEREDDDDRVRLEGADGRDRRQQRLGHAPIGATVGNQPHCASLAVREGNWIYFVAYG